jgi:hypothetical protein
MSDKNIHKVGSDLILLEHGTSTIMTIEGAAISQPGATVNSKVKSKAPIDSSTVLKSKKWSVWGDDDKWPNNLVDTLSKLGVAKSALDINSDFHFGSGIQWMKESSEKDSDVIKHIMANPKGWRNFAYTSGLYSALSRSINSADTFGLAFFRIILTKDDKVFSCSCLDTPSVRKGFRNKSGRIEKVYYGHEICDKSSDEDVIVLPVYNPEDHDEFIKNNKDFVYILEESSWGRFYYPEPNYYATINNGWADIAIEVPKLIRNIYRNQATLKYHIKIPYSNVVKRWKCFEEKTEAEQLQIYSDYKREIESVISKAEAAGSSVFTIYNDGEDKVEITAIQDAINTTKDLPNNVAANSEILFAIGVAPSIIGLNMPGGKDLNGSGGSQLRESIKAKQATLTRERIKSLELCYLIKRIQKYPEDIYPVFVDIDISQTLDENPTGKKTVAQI